VPVNVTPKPPQPPEPAKVDSAIEIAFRPDPTIWDGRFGNVAWLQELPKPFSKLTWDNVIEVSPAVAAQHDLTNGDRVEIAVQGRTMRGAAWIVPGQAPRMVALTFGYGRSAGGELASGSGYDAYAVRPDSRTWYTAGTLKRIDGQYPLASTQAPEWQPWRPPGRFAARHVDRSDS
jgi:molybdopterin-containing oxidoreductase family iron-sulfur binding subunit